MTIPEIKSAIAELIDMLIVTEQATADQAEFDNLMSINQIRTEQEIELLGTESMDERISRLCGEVICNKLESHTQLTEQSMDNLIKLATIREKFNS